MYYAAACQTDFPAPSHRREIAARTARMAEIIEQTVIGYEPFFDVRLLVFPEFAHAVPIHDRVERLYEDLAIEIPNEHTEVYHRLARKHGCYIQTGTFLERDERFPGHVFNTTCLIGPEGLLARYRKVNPWIPWEIHTSPHDLPDYPDDPFPVVETEIGRLGVAICYDWLFPETIRELAFRGAEVLIRVSAYMDPWGSTEPMNWWTLVNRTRALENTAYVVAANQGAEMKNYPPFSWPGGSMAVDYDGRVLAQADPGPGEKVVVAPIDLARLREERQRRRGHDTRSHFRAEVHGYAAQRRLAPAGDELITMDGLNQRIEAARRR
ncbi:nitrilase-related carbon-nitrogen hydrolase [Wenzhouxiangella marina]|uniref:Putative amidohydrolase n=1 Tax=Wenzhouxiangella marina TaxID=1579979 RepID=A0A0K0XZ56_9GAMM|nr:nitrilase-related carbon-nitrogen hydrolase [Wenzhouxiangella marina]AKS42969.1 Putative amidohydrolase [Wenzhouxiangella marina]MBB6087347.1 putative amidohydrolase [Wenzhouxiangella marina]